LEYFVNVVMNIGLFLKRRLSWPAQ